MCELLEDDVPAPIPGGDDRLYLVQADENVAIPSWPGQGDDGPPVLPHRARRWGLAVGRRRGRLPRPPPRLVHRAPVSPEVLAPVTSTWAPDFRSLSRSRSRDDVDD